MTKYPIYESTLPKMGELLVMSDGRKFKVKSVQVQRREDDVIGAYYEFKCTAQEVKDNGPESVQTAKASAPEDSASNL